MLHALFPTLQQVWLERNYRSTGNIVTALNSLIVHNAHRIPKTLVTAAAAGAQIGLTEFRTAEIELEQVLSGMRRASALQGIPLAAMAVLCRTRKTCAETTRFFKQRGVDCRNVPAQGMLRKDVVQDLVALLRLLVNEGDNNSLARILQRFCPELRAETTERMAEVAQARSLSFLRALRLLHSVSASESAVPRPDARGGRASLLLTQTFGGAPSGGRSKAGPSQTSGVESIAPLPGDQVAVVRALLLLIDRLKREVVAQTLLEVVGRAQELHQAFVALAGPRRSTSSVVDGLVAGWLVNAAKKHQRSKEPSLAFAQQRQSVGGGAATELRDFLDALTYFEDQEGVETWEAGEEERGPTVTTIHQAKGLEWRVVFVVRFNEDEIPLAFTGSSTPLASGFAVSGGDSVEDAYLRHESEERRLAYVAISRALEQLHISYVAFNERGQPVAPSRFVSELPQSPGVVHFEAKYDADLPLPGLHPPKRPLRVPARHPPPAHT
eukprot:TRINITY_DN1308_c0_g1_i12.p1 TRINITY_DN1308_c0_g1~~TRINITY_DN1308_c0_g1_i12.p1  ORF type:complete len:496 (-),score=106.18 TRINITY_DN1308_c0_g1_i12:47-1534(-)